MPRNIFIISSICLFLLIKLINASINEYGVLAVESSSEKENFCIIYFKEFRGLPEEKSDAEFHVIDDASSTDWCNDARNDSNSKILLLTRNNCSVTEQASNVQNQGGKAVLFITPSGKVNSIPVNDSFAQDLNITVGLIGENSVKKIRTMGYPVSGRLFAPDSSTFDFSSLVIRFVAMFTIIVGSYWSGHIRFAIYCKEMSLLPGANERELPNKPKVRANTAEDSSINVSAYYIAIFVLCMVTMLLLLYFFFDYLVYVIIGLFVIASILSVHSFLEPLFMKIPTSLCKPFDCRLGSIMCNIDFRQVILVGFSIAVSVWWLVERKQKYAWILQDILGVTFCIHMLKSIRLPSLKICTVLLVLLFFYDIFFVFITPYFTMNGESVMEEVATGGKSEENIPMVIRVPHFRFDALAVCYQQDSILGFGDILIPGLLISYCHGFDLITNKKILYFPVTVAMYAIGLQITYVGLYLMNTAQPALLYLVPFTLIPAILLGWCRGELPLLWKGFKVIRAKAVNKYVNDHITTDVAATEASREAPPVFVHSDQQKEMTPPTPDTVNDVGGEENRLLR